MADIDRRAFLASAPGRLWAQAQTWRGAWRKALAGPEVLPGQRVAVIDIERCTAWGGGLCQACYLSCPQRDTAIRCEEGKPVIVASGCDGCGACLAACRNVNDRGAILLSQVVGT